MKKRILLGTVALAAMATSALAADLPSRRAPPVYVPPIPVFSWTGFYVGGQAGYTFGKDNVARTGGPAAFPTGTTNPSGFLAGGHLGYNFSTQSLGFGGIGGGGLVIGVEGDLDGSDYSNIPRTIRTDIQGSARGRVGIAVDRALFYATGGAAIAQFHNTFGAVGGFPGAAPSTTRVGWTVGGGVEYAITTQWSLRAEYRYSDFDRFRYQLAPGFNVTRRETMQRAQAGFSYKFDMAAPAPVVARY